MKFTKMNGAGNDFIIFNNIEEHIPQTEFSRLVSSLCERHLSLGADGVMFVEKPSADGIAKGADLRMVFYNADGSEGEMCGNGARCICRYAYERGFSGEEQVIETISGIIRGRRISEREYSIRLADPSVIIPDMKLEIDGYKFHAAYLELGTPGLPHLVAAFSEVRKYAKSTSSAALAGNNLIMSDPAFLSRLGRKLRYHSLLPKGANVNFYELAENEADLFYERTFERGVEDFTYACGTGTGCTTLILTLEGKVSGKNVRGHMRGGCLGVTIEECGISADGTPHAKGIILSGPAVFIAEGELSPEALF